MSREPTRACELLVGLEDMAVLEVEEAVRDGRRLS